MKSAILAVLAVSVAGAVPNVAMEAILCPFGVVDSGQTVTPRVVVRNAGDVAADSFWTHFTIDNEMDMVICHDSAIVHGLEPGTSDTIGFTPWVPVGRDSMGALAWTWWDGDSVPEDDSLVQRFLVRVKDIAITQVYNPIPGDTIDPGALYPQVYVWNYGNLTTTFPLIFNIGPWFDTVWVTVLAGGSRTVTATSPCTTTAGVWLCNMNAQIAGDLHPENNDTTFVFYVRGTIDDDIAVEAILCPCGVMDTTPFYPAARISNYGTTIDSFWLWFWIDDSAGDIVYGDTILVFPDSTRRPFRPCTLRVPGFYVASCSVYLETDQNRLNDVIHQGFRVGTGAEHDILLAAILAPIGTIDSAAVVTPKAVVFNAGLWPETFPVYFQLPGGYLANITVMDLPVGAYDTLSFPNWHANVPGGSYQAVAWVPGDTLIEPFFVQVRDLKVEGIAWPRDTVRNRTRVFPSCVVSNMGTTVETFEVLFQIGLFSARETVFNMPPYSSAFVHFGAGWLSSPGVWLSRAEIIPHPADPNPGNNVVYDTFWVIGTIDHDVGVESVNSPVGTHDTVGMLDVTATVRNYGANGETFWTYFSIFDDSNAMVYRDSVLTVELAAESTRSIAFGSADINVPGRYTVRCSTYLADDQNWTNNLLTSMFRVDFDPGFPEGWAEAASMPAAPSGKPVKHGAWATSNHGNRLIYAAKGNKTNDFYSYDLFGSYPMGTWTELSGMPFQIHPSWGSKAPYKGSKGASDGENSIYVTQGNNTLGFWRYDINADTWLVLPDVPTGPDDRKVKGGTDLVYVPGDTGYVYCLKGYGTEFYRFNAMTLAWQVLDDAPSGARDRWDRGSWLVWDEDRYLYAHKAKYNELYRYDLETGKWDSTRLTGMPFIGMLGRRKRSGAGGSAAYHDGLLWALKGGNTLEWWKYDTAADTWAEMDTMPVRGSTRRRKRVKCGADVVHWGSGPAFFTLKGNKTVELWRFAERPIGSERPPRSGITGMVALPNSPWFRAMPNPFRASVATGFSLPEAGNVDLAVYSSDGRRVRTLACGRLEAGRYEVVWDGSGEAGRPVARSVYYLRLVAGNCVLQKKLVKTE